MQQHIEMSWLISLFNYKFHQHDMRLNYCLLQVKVCYSKNNTKQYNVKCRPKHSRHNYFSSVGKLVEKIVDI